MYVLYVMYVMYVVMYILYVLYVLYVLYLCEVVVYGVGVNLWTIHLAHLYAWPLISLGPAPTTLHVVSRALEGSTSTWAQAKRYSRLYLC